MTFGTLGLGAGGTGLTATTQSANTVWSGPPSGAAAAPTFRNLVANDLFSAVNNQTGTTYTVVAGDQAKLITISNAAAIAVTLPQATGSFGSGWFAFFEDRGAGTATITPTTSTIDGATSLALTQNQGVCIFSDGTNYFTGCRGTGGGGGGTTINVNGAALAGTTGNLSNSTPAAPTNTPGGINVTWQKDSGSPSTNVSGYLLGAVPRPASKRRWAALQGGVSGSGGVLGALESAVQTSPGAAAGWTSTSQPENTPYGTVATIGSNAGIEAANSNEWGIATNIHFEMKFKLDTTSSVRMWAGIAGTVLATMLGSDTPAQNFAALRFSTVASDTTFKCVTGNGTTTTVVDTTIAPGTSFHVVQIDFNDAVPNVSFTLDGTSRCSSPITTTLPTQGTAVEWLGGVQTEAAASATFRHTTTYMESDP